MIVAGIMSGTSLDGIDVAIVEMKGQRFEVLAFSTTPYPKRIREALLAVSNCDTHTSRISELNFELPELYAAAVRRIWKKPLDLAGCHGQTIHHSAKSTLQIGDGSILAERLGVPVVSNLRARDMAVGGQGAPLVPYLDYKLFRHPKRGRVALNLGGIANITAIPQNSAPGDVMAFDTGPANMVIDALMIHHSGGRQTFDRDGRVAATGHVCQPLLKQLMADPFLKKRPPKSAGREQYGREFVDEILRSEIPLPDAIATATVFTAASIAESIRRFVQPRMQVDDLIAGGGGVRNRTLMAYLGGFLPGVRIATTDSYGIHPDAKEAVAFAVMAAETWRHRPSNVPSATGARKAVVLGVIAR